MCIESNHESSENDTLLEKDKDESSDVETDQPDDPLAGFFFLGFVANLGFNYLMQEAKLLGDIFGKEFGNNAAIIFSISTFLGQLFMFFLGGKMSYNLRFPLSSFMLAVGMISVPLLTFWGWRLRIWIVYGMVVVMGLMTAMINSSGFSFTSLCSPKVRLYFTLGTCLAGITGWLTIQFVWYALTWGFKMTAVRESAEVPVRAEIITCLVVLGSAAALFVIAIFFYLFSLSKTPAAQRALARAEANKTRTDDKTEEKVSETDSVMAAASLAIAVAGVMCSTFIVMPDLILKWDPSFTYKNWSPTFFHDSMLFIFNVCDVIGRLLAVFVIPLTATQVFKGSFLRWALVPLFFLALYQKWMFANDLVRLLVQSAFGITYGLIVTWGFTLAPSQSGVNPKYAASVGAFMSCSAVLGILIGAGLAKPVAKMVDTLVGFKTDDVFAIPSTLSMVAINEIPLLAENTVLN